MTRPRTLVIRDPGDQDTMVDPRGRSASGASEVTVLLEETARLHDVVPPFEGTGRAASDGGLASRRPPRPGFALGRWRAMMSPSATQRTLQLGIRLALAGVVGLVAFQQWRINEELRGTIAELRGAPTFVPPRSREAPRQDRPINAKSKASFPDAPPSQAVDREQLEVLGARLVAANDYRGALSTYRKLAAQFPDDAVFRVMVIALESKTRCGSLDSGVVPCP